MFNEETVGIAIGLALALGIFSFKTAVGEYYLAALPCAKLRKGIIISLLLGLYYALFLAAFAIMEQISLFHLAKNSKTFLDAGIPLHLLLCTGLMIWGVKLLASPGTDSGKGENSRGWLLLAIPCPVCASAVFLVCAFASMLFPESIRVLRWAIPVFFLISNLFFLLLLYAAGKIFQLKPLSVTGIAMILIALYFFLILTVAPVMDDAGKLYAAACSASTQPDLSWNVLLAPGIVCFAGFSGFFLNYFKKTGV